ncbi:MAG: DUF1439 domain-containing protein [Symploca sp. SIO2B6]|nr:DUF1439 domain-containing protein [Symploca sp. SIO2B6]
MKRSKVTLVIIVAIATILIALFVFPRELVVKIPQHQIQQHIEAEFPIEKDLLLLIAQIRNPIVSLDKTSERVTLTVEIAINVIGASERIGRASLSSAIEYQSDQGIFYLDNIRLDSFNFDLFPNQYLDKVISIINAISSDVIETIPIHTLDTDQFEQRTIKWVLKDVAIADNELVLTLGR